MLENKYVMTFYCNTHIHLATAITWSIFSLIFFIFWRRTGTFSPYNNTSINWLALRSDVVIKQGAGRGHSYYYRATTIDQRGLMLWK
jgi:hypothetical protein